MRKIAEISSSQPDDELVEMFERLLEGAKTGKIRSAAVAAVSRDGKIKTSYVAYERTIALIGTIGLLKYRVERFFDEGAEVIAEDEA